VLVSGANELPPTQLTGTERISVLPREQSQALQNAGTSVRLPDPNTPQRAAEFEISVRYSDRRGTRYRTVYSMVAHDKVFSGVEELAPGLVLSDRRTLD